MGNRLRIVCLSVPFAMILAACEQGEIVTPGSEDNFENPVLLAAEGAPTSLAAATEAPTGFNPAAPNGDCEADECAEALEEFTGPETVADGVGVIFNEIGCGNCHAQPAIGGSSQILEKRAGRTVNGVFTDHANGSLINSRVLSEIPGYEECTERVAANDNTTTFRSSISIFGDGFVEAIDSNTLLAIANAQPAAQRGLFIQVPVLESPGAVRGGRFGHKNQHASLLSFAADAYLNEMGITSPLQPTENVSEACNVADFDGTPDPEDDGVDVELFAVFMRSTTAPPRAPSASSAQARAGEQVFSRIGCAVCHTPTIVTSPPGTVINGGALVVSAALGNKIIHPFSDFLLHNIGTGDGIVQNGGAATRNRIKTAALWGLRTRSTLMHDGMSLTVENAIDRHRNEAADSRSRFNALSTTDRNALGAFLRSL